MHRCHVFVCLFVLLFIINIFILLFVSLGNLWVGYLKIYIYIYKAAKKTNEKGGCMVKLAYSIYAIIQQL